MVQIETQHGEFIDALKKKFGVDEVREEFTNLRKLDAIDKKISEISGKIVLPKNIDVLKEEINSIGRRIEDLKSNLENIDTNTRKALENKGFKLFR